MEIAENITWTEELERLDALLSQGQFELLLPGERYGGGEKEIAVFQPPFTGSASV